MTPATRATVLKALGERHDALLEQLYQGRLTRYAKWHGPLSPNPQRVDMARELRALRSAMRELKPAAWPTAYAQPDQALATYHREGR